MKSPILHYNQPADHEIIRHDRRMYTIELFPWDDTPVKVTFRFCLVKRPPDPFGSRCEWRAEIVAMTGAQVDHLDPDEHYYRHKGLMLTHRQYVYGCLLDIIEMMGGKEGVEEEYANTPPPWLHYK